MNLDIAIREENGVVKLKITSPEKPVVIETEDDTLQAEATACRCRDGLSPNNR